MHPLKIILALGVSGLALVCRAGSLDSVPTDTLAPVEVASARNPAEFDAKKAAAVMDLFGSIPAGERSRIRLSFHIQTASGRPLSSDIRLALFKGDEFISNLKLLPTGELEMPNLTPAQASGVVVVSNAASGSLKINYYIQPLVIGPVQRLGDLRVAIHQARAAWAVLYGPLLGWTVPWFDCLGIRYREPRQVSLLTPAGERAWESERSRNVTLPLNLREQSDELLIEWGGVLPDRVGACVIGQPPGQSRQ